MSDRSSETTENFTPDFIRERILAAPARAEVLRWGLREYGEILTLQETLRSRRQADEIPDTWLVGEHPAVITQGVRGAAQDLVSQGAFPIFNVDRGGQTTIHNPGQLVIYPVIRTQGGVLAQARVSRALLATFAAWLEAVSGVLLEIPRGRPGLFFEGRKIAALGISIHSSVTMHGIAVNVCNDLAPWHAIIPCGEPETRPATLSEIAGKRFDPAQFAADLELFLTSAWGYAEALPAPLPLLN